MIEVSRLKDVNAAELFLGFRTGAVGRRDFAVFPVQGHRGLRRLKRYFGNNMSVGAQMVVVLKAFVEHCVLLVLGQRNLARWLVQPIVAGHRENRQQSQFFIATPSATLRGTDALARTEPGPAPSHTNHAPPQAFPACGTSPPARSARDGSWRVPRGPARRR